MDEYLRANYERLVQEQYGGDWRRLAAEVERTDPALAEVLRGFAGKQQRETTTHKRVRERR